MAGGGDVVGAERAEVKSSRVPPSLLGWVWLRCFERLGAAWNKVKSGSRGRGAAELRAPAGTPETTRPAGAGRPENEGQIRGSLSGFGD